MRHVGVAFGFHARDRRKHRHRRLAHRHQMTIAAERMQDRDQIVDVIVEIEVTVRQRHQPRIHPFGDVDVVVRQKRLDRAAQQRRVMARHRRHDHELRLRTARRRGEDALEMQEPAERPLPDRRDVHRDAFAADQRVRDIPVRLAVAAGEALEHFRARGERLADRRMVPRIERIFQIEPRDVGKGARRIERGMAHFVEPVHSIGDDRAAFTRQSRCPAKFTNRHSSFPGSPVVQRNIGVFGRRRQYRRNGVPNCLHIGHSPVCISDPTARALFSRARKAITAATK